MAIQQTLIACRRYGSPFDPLTLDTFAADGSFLANYDYRSDIADATTIECPIGRPSGTFLFKASALTTFRTTNTLAYTSQAQLTNPIDANPGAPQLYPNIPHAATKVVGLWQDGGTPNLTVLQSIDPSTLAQTTLWSDFQATPNAGVAGCGLSRDGLTWYYAEDVSGTIYALNLTTGVSTSFITPYSGGANPVTYGTYSLYHLADGTFLVFWQVSADDMRVVQYTAAGSPSGIDILIANFKGVGVFAPDVDGSGVWVLGYSYTDAGLRLRRYLIPGGTLDVEETPPDAAADYIDLLVGTLLQPVPIDPPKAPPTPCEPDVESNSVGQAGCNKGGTGWSSQYSGPYDTVPEHADPVDGETLTDKRGIDVWFEWRHRNTAASPSTTDVYRRSFVELGHVTDYEDGRKPEGLKAVGDVEHALGNELHAFETSTVTAEYADQTDRLVRALVDGESIKKDEFYIKGASPAGVAASTPPRIFARSVIERANLSSPMSASIVATDQIAAQFDVKKYPTWMFKDLGDAIPNAPPDILDLPIKPLYGEKSDFDADPESKGLIPGIYCGRFDLTGLDIPVPPDSPGWDFDALVAAMQVSCDANTLEADWGGCIGIADAQVLQAQGVIPTEYTRLAQSIGHADLDAILDGSCGGGTTAAPDDTAWGLIIFGLGDWHSFLNLYGFGNGSATEEHVRVLLDPSARSDMLVPGFTWPFATNYIALTNPTTQRVFWVTGIYVRGPLLEDHIKGGINIAGNFMGLKGNAGLPIIDAHAVEQHWHENFVQNNWSSGDWADETDYPKWGDGTPKVRSSSFAARQAYTLAQLGGRGLTVGWWPDQVRSIKAWIEAWDRETETKTGVNGHWQIVKYGFDPDVDTSAFRRVDHVEHVFGQIRMTPGQDPENVQVGSCDYDGDFNIYRIGPITRTNDEGHDWNAATDTEPKPILSTILNDATQLAWVLDQRNLRLRFGSTFIDLPGAIGLWDTDVGSGVLLTTIEGTGAAGFVGRRCVVLRKKFSFATRIVTSTLWDIERLLA